MLSGLAQGPQNQWAEVWVQSKLGNGPFTAHNVLLPPHASIQHRENTPVHLNYGKRKQKERKISEHLNFKSTHIALRQKKKMYLQRRFENHRLLGFEANLYFNTAENHYCPINFRK